MCGIAGVAGPFAPEERTELLRRMGEALVHRGPDDAGTFAGEEIGLVARRLSIVDVEGGRQPLVNEDGSVVCVCNGEIYNSPELRHDLETKGHRFATASDCEVLVHLYEEHGAELVHQLRGMFAFALWDRRRRSLLLARDPFGVKPLVYSVRGSHLYFASEAKAILATRRVAAAPDLAALGGIAHLGFVVTPRTMFAGIDKLPPGHLLEWHDGEGSLRRYWEPSFPTPEEVGRAAPVDKRAAAEELRQRLDESVRVHLQSDVPVGVMLSGGLDSSAVLALAARHSGRRLTAFTLGFEDPSYDEFDRAVTLRDDDRWDSVHARCTHAHLESLPEVMWHVERPCAGLEVARLLIARTIASRGFKVVLTGEGADELFGGYHWYHGQRLAAPFSQLPAQLRELVARAGARLRPRFARTLRAPAEMGMERFAAMAGSPDVDTFASLLTAEAAAEVRLPELFPAPGVAVSSWERFAQLQYFDQRVRLADFIVDNLDSTSMAASVEARVPFLDREVAALARALPAAMKMRGRTEKHVLREAMRGVLPEPVRTRKKHGLEVPAAKWLRRPLPERLEALLSPAALDRHGLFRADRVRRLVDEQRATGAVDRTAILWKVLTLQLWLDVFTDGGRITGPVSSL